MKSPKLPRDPMARAFAIGEQSTAEPAETFDGLGRKGSKELLPRYGASLLRVRPATTKTPASA